MVQYEIETTKRPRCADQDSPCATPASAGEEDGTRCEYCFHRFSDRGLDWHRRNCPMNPLVQETTSVVDAYLVDCQYCYAGIPARGLVWHERTCVVNPNVEGGWKLRVPCRYCNEEYHKRGITLHQLYCIHNPESRRVRSKPTIQDQPPAHPHLLVPALSPFHPDRSLDVLSSAVHASNWPPPHEYMARTDSGRSIPCGGTPLASPSPLLLSTRRASYTLTYKIAVLDQYNQWRKDCKVPLGRSGIASLRMFKEGTGLTVPSTTLKHWILDEARLRVAVQAYPRALKLRPHDPFSKQRQMALYTPRGE